MANEKRLIDANALMKEIMFDHNCVMQDPEISKQMKWRESVCYQRSMRAIEKAPTVDAVEVVRCKDCKHWRRNHIAGIPSGICIYGKPRRMKPDDFCSYGERKTNESAKC